MRKKALPFLAICTLCVTLQAVAQYQIHFDKPVYSISRGQSFTVQVLIDPAPVDGLSSFGIVASFPAGNANLANTSSVLLPADLDFNGVRGSGAVKSVGAGFAAFKGTVDFAPSPAPTHSSGILATITVQDLGIGPYTLNLSAFNTLGATEQIFVDGLGNALDPKIAFASATVEYITPPQQSDYAIFAGEPGERAKSKILWFKGIRNKVTGSIHSNSGIKVGGSHHIFRNGVVEYVTDIQPPPNFGGKVTFESSSLARSTNKPYPVNFVLHDYAPDGRAAVAAQSVGKYYYIRARRTDLSSYVQHGVLREGLYYVDGAVDLDHDRIRQGHVTIVATGKIAFDLDDAIFESFSDNLLAFTPENDCNSPTIKISARNNRWRGIVFSPNGLIEVHGDNEGNEWDERDDDHGNDRRDNDDHRDGDSRDDHEGRDEDRHDDCHWRTDNTTLVGALIGKQIRVNARNLQITGLNSTNAIQQPLIAPLQCLVQGGELQLCFPTSLGLTYAIDYCDSLVNPDWRTWCIVEGNGGITTLKPPVVGVAQRYYRLRLH